MLSLISFAAIPSLPALAAGTVYLSSANSSVIQGSNFTLQLRISPGTPVTAVQATVNFVPSQLQYVSISYSGSPFNQEMPGSTTASSISMTRFMLNSAGTSADSLIASITFKALSSSGTSSVTLSGVDAIYGADSTSPAASNASVAFVAASCPSGQVGTPPNCTTPTSSTPNTPKPSPSSPTTPQTPQPSSPQASTVKLEVPSVSETVFQYTTARIVAKTNKSARVLVKYGTASDKLILQTSFTPEGTDHTINIAEGLTPGSEVFYVVLADDGTTTQQTQVSNATTKGLAVRVGLLDKNLLRIRNQEVTLKPTNKVVRSDTSGYVEFQELAPGDYTLEFSTAGQIYSQTFNLMSNVTTVEGVQASETQTKAVIYDDFVSAAGVPSWVITIISIISGLIIVGALGYLAWRFRQSLANIFHRPLKPSARSAEVEKPAEPVVIWPDTKTPHEVGADWRSKHE